MHKSFLRLLDDTNAKVINVIEENDEIIQGKLIFGNKQYQIIDGVPVFFIEGVLDNSKEQIQTNKTFSYKWGEVCTRYNTQAFNVSMKFVMKRLKPLGIHNENDFKNFLRDRKTILEVGSGMGWMSYYMAQNTDGDVISCEIGNGVFKGYNLCKELNNCHMVKADLMNLPFANEFFDYIHADGVLHHTPDCKNAIKTLYDKLNRGGVFWFYIYKEMNPVKHFCDDYIRKVYSEMEPSEALEECKAFTELGRELSKITAKIKLDRPIKILNIPAGIYDVQRFIYYNFLKCYWNEEAGYEYSNITNYDWYTPNNASQQTVDEVEGWLKEFGIEKYDFYVGNPNGLNVVLYK